MKEMSKKKIIDKKSVQSILNERELLSKMDHPFIINMHFAFQDKDYVYLAMDLLTGGDLRFHLCYDKPFSEEQTKFIISNLILGLEYIHSNKIIHRDIKPENLVFDSNGYIKLTDFGIAKIQQENNKHETSGTPGYMSPEVICSQNHTVSADYFAVGVIAYELMVGHRPYVGKNRAEIREKIMSKQARVTRGDMPKGWSIESADFINKLLMRKPLQRLGANGIQEIKSHPWLKYYVWKDVYLRKVKAPFIPSQNMDDNYDSNYCNFVEKLDIATQERYNQIARSDLYLNGFNDYSYFNRYILLEKFKEHLYSNPHLIYSELEAKEKLAFNLSTEENEKKKGHRRNLLSMNEKGIGRILSSISSKSIGKNKLTLTTKHRKNVKSVQIGA